jgi:hypothetical protein
MCRLLFRALVALSVPAIAGSQQLTGVVRDSTSRAPLAGAVVSAMDASGATVRRAITDASGRWSLAAVDRPARIHVIKIGFRPADVAVPGDEASFDVAMVRLPAVLEAMRISGREICPGSSDRGAAFQLWEQARAGLLAAVVARELKPAAATIVTYERALSPGDEIVRRQRTTTKTGQTTRPFRSSAPPAIFAQLGYMTDDSTGRLFSAPDADVLLDESFGATHCFHLQSADGAHPAQIGLAFTPARGRDTLVDVKGVIWMDATPNLRSLDFSYTSLEPAAMDLPAGGRIEFQTMENGVAFISRWWLRLPNLEPVPAFSNPLPNMPAQRGSGVVRRSERRDQRIAEVSETGGIVLDARWPDGVHAHDEPARIVGSVARKNSAGGVPYATVTFAAGDETVADSAGAFTHELVPGKYIVTASDTTFAAYVAPRTASRRVEAVRGRTAVVRLELPTLTTVLADRCEGHKIRANTAMLLGHLTAGDGAPLPAGVRVHAAWQADYSPPTAIAMAVLSEAQDVEIDDDGRFAVCGVARERPIRLTLLSGESALADTVLKIFNINPVIDIDWVVRRAPAGVPRTAALDGAELKGGRTAADAAWLSVPSAADSAGRGPCGPALATSYGYSHSSQGAHGWLIGTKLIMDAISTDIFACGRRMSRTFSKIPTASTSFATTFGLVARSRTPVRRRDSMPSM